MMEQAVNFYELKNRLADLGYNEPEVTDQLRSIVSQDEFDSALVHTRKEGVKFEFELSRNTKGDFELGFNHAWLDTGEGIVSRIFEPDMPVDDAITKLYQKVFDEPHLDGLNYKLQNQYIMNNENLSYLQKQLLNLGFGEQLNEDLEKNIRSKATEFTLPATLEYNQQNVDYKLHFKAGGENEMYFFNKYDAKIQNKDPEHTFYINRGSGITAKEAYNLLEGRSVHKQLENLENEKYNAWLTLDGGKMRTFNDKWNYHPEKPIDMMDIVGIGEPGAKDKLMKSLEKGNRHQVTAMKNGKEVKLFIEANPAEHRVNLTNWKGEAQQLEHYKKAEFKQDKKHDSKQTQNVDGAEEGTKKKRTRGAKVTA
ncbi:hypothetical protein ACFGVR_15640 [Mucilaginibacter sp. AW1-3]